MTLRHYEIFSTVAETGNFTKAAEKLYITQSGVSHAIRELEEKAGTALFDRMAKSVRLTESGKLLLKEITPILASCQALESRIGRLESDAPIHIVSSITIAAFWLPDILNRFKQCWPDTPVEVDVVSAANAVESLGAGRADLAFIEGAEPQGPFICKPFAHYEMTAVCAPGYLTPRRTLSVAELCSEKLLLREKGSAIRDTLDSALYLQGYSIHPVWTSVNSTALVEAAKAGLGITILPDLLVRHQIREHSLEEVFIDGAALKNELSILIHQNKYIPESLQALIRLAAGGL